MKYLFLFILALIFCGAMAMVHVSKEMTVLANVEMRKNAELISFESSYSNAAVEVDGIRFETVVPNQTLSIPENRPDVQTTWLFGVRVTNNTSLPKRISKCSFTPEFIGLNGNIIFVGSQCGFSRPPESNFPLVPSGESLTLFWEGRFYWSKNMLLLGVDSKLNVALLTFGIFSPGTYHIRLTYYNDATNFWYYDQEKQEIMEIREVLKGQFSTPWVEINLVAP